MIVTIFCLFAFVGFATSAGNSKVPVKNLVPTGKMPIIGYGTYSVLNQAALDTALETGYRHIDTAFIYQNENVVGQVLSRWLGQGKLKRDDLFVVTKLPSYGNTPQGVQEYLDKSLKSLNLKYVDLYLIHSYTDGDMVAVWKAMENQVDLGKAKAIGLSNFNEEQIKPILNNARIWPANLQVEIHPYLQQRSLVDFCAKNNITVTAYSPLGAPHINSQGFLNHKGQKLPRVLDHPVIAEIAKRYKKTAAQVILRHAIQRGLIVIPKSSNPKRIKENFDILDFELSQEDMKKMNDLDLGEYGRIFS